MMTLRKWSLAALAMLLAAGMAWAQAQEPSLGDVARQQRAQPKKAKKIVTDDDMPKRASEPEAPKAAPAPQQNTAGEPGKTDAAPKDAAAADSPDKQATLTRIQELKVSEDTEKRI